MQDDPYASIATPVADDPYAAIATVPDTTPKPRQRGPVERFAVNFNEGFGVPESVQYNPVEGIQGIGKAIQHPALEAESLKQMWDNMSTAQQDLIDRAYTKQHAPGIANKFQGFLLGVYSAVPVFGPAIVKALDQMQSGDVAGGAGAMTSVITQLGARPLTEAARPVGDAVNAGLSKVGQLRKAATDAVQPFARKITGVEPAAKEAVGKAAEGFAKATDKAGIQQQKINRATDLRNRATAEQHQGAIRDTYAANEQAKAEHTLSTEEAQAEAARQNQEATAAHQTEAQRVAQENQAAEQTLGLRQQSESDLQGKTDAYYAKEDQVKATAKAQNDQNWNAWRAKVGDSEVDVQPVRDTIERVSAQFPEVKQILKDSAPSEEDLSATNLQYISDRRNFMKQYGYGTDYDTLAPDRKMQVDDMMSRMGLQPEDAGVAIDSSKPLTIKQVHDLKTQIGWKVFRNEYPPNVTGAMKQVLKSLDQTEARASVTAGAVDELNAARQSHQQFQEAFGRSRPKRAVEGELRKKGANPEAYSQKEEDARLAAVSKYDPSLATDYQSIVELRKNTKGLPTEQQLRKGVKQPPEAPLPIEAKAIPGPEVRERPAAPKLQAPRQVDLLASPTVDLKQVAAKAIETRAKNWGTFNARDVGILASSILAEPIMKLLGGAPQGPMSLLPAAAIAYEGGKYGASRFLNKPGVIEWLSRTPQAELDVINKIPGADKVTIVNGMTDAALDSAKNGKPVRLSPQARQLLGPENVAKIVAAGGAGQTTVNNRKDALQLLGK